MTSDVASSSTDMEMTTSLFDAAVVIPPCCRLDVGSLRSSEYVNQMRKEAETRDRKQTLSVCWRFYCSQNHSVVLTKTSPDINSLILLVTKAEPESSLYKYTSVRTGGLEKVSFLQKCVRFAESNNREMAGREER